MSCAPVRRGSPQVLYLPVPGRLCLRRVRHPRRAAASRRGTQKGATGGLWGVASRVGPRPWSRHATLSPGSNAARGPPPAPSGGARPARGRAPRARPRSPGTRDRRRAVAVAAPRAPAVPQPPPRLRPPSGPWAPQRGRGGKRPRCRWGCRRGHAAGAGATGAGAGRAGGRRCGCVRRPNGRRRGATPAARRARRARRGGATAAPAGLRARGGTQRRAARL